MRAIDVCLMASFAFFGLSARRRCATILVELPPNAKNDYRAHATDATELVRVRRESPQNKSAWAATLKRSAERFYAKRGKSRTPKINPQVQSCSWPTLQRNSLGLLR